MAPEERNPSNTQEEATQEVRGQDPGSKEPQAAGQVQASRGPTAGLIDQLAERGFGVVDDFVDAGLLTQLRWRCSELQASGALRPAKMGRGASERLEPEVRGDFISWVQQPTRDAEQDLLARLDDLRVALNRALMTGLEDFQGHFAVYPKGSAYARHFDRLQGSDLRAISAALYLNDAWTAEDGGQLRMYLGGNRSEDVIPKGGRLVAFLSDRFEHEVLPAKRERMSFTGWFRRRSLDGFV
jgi:SM-20-related protein